MYPASIKPATMKTKGSKKTLWFVPFTVGLTTLLCMAIAPRSTSQSIAPKGMQANAGLVLPPGFKARIISEVKGRPRHIVATKNGSLYVKLRNLVDGKGIVQLRDTDKDGSYEVVTAFGRFPGTGIALKDHYLYASSDTEVFRFRLDDQGNVIDTAQAERIITGLKAGRQHQTKSITLDNDGFIYVNIGAYSNACQVEDRGLRSKGIPGCPLLDSAGGIWQFRSDKPDQSYGEGVRYATGLRNVMGLDWNSQTNSLFVMQHGRDNLNSSWPDLFDTRQSAELPSEVMYELHKGDNAGWPYSYYDHLQGKKILAPEYGGDGKIEGGKEYINPVVAFPGHLAPNALLFYTGDGFGEKYRQGAFVAFHGSWNRAPEKQLGYFVAFVPFRHGRPSGAWEIFADNFSGTETVMNPREAAHRPCGLALGADGALYVSDDVKGTIYRIEYTGK